MYDERIEALIKAALADGVLTEKERQILFKNAEAQGIDLDEFEMILDARIVEQKKLEQEKEEKLKLEKARIEAQKTPAAPTSNKFGDVRKCPNCGAIIESLQSKCKECGYEFTNISSVSSAQRFAEAISKAMDEDQKRGTFSQLASVFLSQSSKLQMTIDTFPIPNTKEDLFEFMVSLEPKTKDGFMNSSVSPEIKNAYKRKYEECLNKVRALFPDDPMFEPYMQKKKKKRFGLF